MSGSTFVSSRLDSISVRFNEIDVLLVQANKNLSDSIIYATLCRSAHVLLVSHVEGIYKDIVRDIIDDLNRNTNFETIKKSIFRTHSLHFTNTRDIDKSTEILKDRLWEALKRHKTELVLEPFLRTDNKNPTPKILEEILKKFGESMFFDNLVDTKLESVFENNNIASLKELGRIKNYLIKGVQKFPYTVDKNYYYNKGRQILKKEQKGLFEEFLNQFLNDRHKIIHGHTLDSPKNHKEIADSKIKIEILIYAFIITLCHSSNPVIQI